ncbi:MAG: MBL fold metallo-hydrolase [Desulfobacteraceae bacterium]|jgi:ribonuclease BN (tRNA processing enzyme)
MIIKILGTGGAINNGLPYNSFIINEDLLVETPPDIMTSLFREGINRKNISAIYISHFHADHCFGLPFLLLRNFIDRYSTYIKMIGPKGIEQRVTEICTLAFGAEHLMMKWIKDHVTYEEIEHGREIKINTQYKLTPVKMFHSPETYGFVLESEGKKTTYIADTYWEDCLLEYIEDADTVLIDLNGEKSDKSKVHISEYDLEQHALPNLKKKDTIFFGTHLKVNKTSNNKNIRYLIPGEEIEV